MDSTSATEPDEHGDYRFTCAIIGRYIGASTSNVNARIVKSRFHADYRLRYNRTGAPVRGYRREVLRLFPEYLGINQFPDLLPIFSVQTDATLAEVADMLGVTEAKGTALIVEQFGERAIEYRRAVGDTSAEPELVPVIGRGKLPRLEATTFYAQYSGIFEYYWVTPQQVADLVFVHLNVRILLETVTRDLEESGLGALRLEPPNGTATLYPVQALHLFGLTILRGRVVPIPRTTH